MVKNLFRVTLLAFVFGIAAAPTPAPAIDYLCSCTVCTSSSSGLGCRDPRNGYRFTSCGTYYTQNCQ